MKRATPFVLLLFTLSGTSGLIYEIVWIRQLSHLLGGTSYAISTVLAAFMGGLALGSRFFGPRADRNPRPLRLYALLEFGIAALALLVFFLIQVAPPLYVRLAHVLPVQALGVLRVVIALLLIVPPTFLMGGTLPVLSRFIVRSRQRMGRGLGLLYGVNTFGAVLGSFLAGFALIATLGHAGSTALAFLINVAIGMAVWIIDRGLAPLEVSGAMAEASVAQTSTPSGKGAARGKTATADSEPEMNWRLLAAIFAASGFASLGYELYWTRGLKHFLGNSTYAFSAMLTTFLLGLALGGWLGGRLVDRVRGPARLLGWVQIGVGVAVLGTVLLIWEWLPRLGETPYFFSHRVSWTSYLMRRFLVAAAVMAIPTFLTGMTFPIVTRIGIRDLSRLGHGVGGLYFTNTLGAILGSLMAGFVILPLLGAKTALVATGMLSALLGLIAHLGSRQRGSIEPWAALFVFVGLLAFAPSVNGSGRTLLSDSQDKIDRVLFEQEDHAGETRVYRKPKSGELHMSVDGHHIGGTEVGILRKEKILAHLPMMLHPEAVRSLSVGLGSGITLGTLALYENLQELSCVEIVPGVVKGAKLFRSQNRAVISDPRSNIQVGDGVQFLLTTRERFDIISSDSKLNPEYSGNAPLLSLDYYRLCRDRLSDKGVMVQWLAAHTPNSELKIIVRSFVEAFPYASIYWFDPYNIILAGSRTPLSLDFDAAREYITRDGLAEDLKDLLLDDPYITASLYVAGKEDILARLGDGPVNTWQRPRLEFSMAREFRRKQTPYHEDENLRWLRQMHQPSSQILRGDYDPETLERFYYSGGKLLEAFAAGGGISRLETGESFLREGFEANPDDLRMSHYLGSIESLSSGLHKAKDEGKINTAEDMVRMGLVLLGDEEHVEALSWFEQALALRPDDPNIQYNRLRTLRELRRWDEMRSALNVFRKEFPRDARGFSMQGRLYANDGQLEKARREFEQAVEIDPQSPTYLNNLATNLARLEQYGEAAEVFVRVCDLEPNYQGAPYFAAASFSMANRNEESAHWVRYCIERGYAEAEQFLESEFFENLLASEHWDPALLERP